MMARIRSIKPELRTSLTVGSWSRDVRYLWVLLWGYLDDHGRGVDDPRLIKADCLPLDDDVTPVVIDQWVSIIAASGPICRYEVNGRRYLHCPAWDEHQRPSHPSPSRVPPCPHGEHPPTPRSSIPEPIPKDSGISPEPVARDSSLSREQGAGSREQVLPPPLARTTPAAGPPGEPPATPSEPIEAEIVDDHPPNLPTLTTVNGGTLTRQWIDHCAAHGVKLTTRAIKRYGAAIKDALQQGFPPDLIKSALAAQLADNEAARPALFDNYLIRAQTGPPRPVRRMTPGEDSVARLAAGSDAATIAELLAVGSAS